MKFFRHPKTNFSMIKKLKMESEVEGRRESLKNAVERSSKMLVLLCMSVYVCVCMYVM